jgi:hypothetical protein
MVAVTVIVGTMIGMIIAVMTMIMVISKRNGLAVAGLSETGPATQWRSSGVLRDAGKP